MDNKKIPQAISTILGLSRQENAILSAISDMAKQISTIARLTKLPRTSLLYILKNLEKRNLVKPIKINKHKYWKSNTINAFRMLRNATPEIIVHNGIPEILNIFERLANQPFNSRIRAIQPDNSIKYALRKVPVKFLYSINTAIKDNKYIFEGIVHEKSVSTIISELGRSDAKKIYNSFIGRLEDYVKIPSDFANVESEIYIFGASAYIINWNREIGLEINNKDIVELLIAMFSCVKELGTRYNQYKEMEATLPNTIQ